MKIIATSDWHIGNLFHGNDRKSEHLHFFDWLLDKISLYNPDALLVAGDVFDNANPSAAAQAIYYDFLAKAIKISPEMKIVITAGNHDSAYRLEAPRALLTRQNVEIRGYVPRVWVNSENGGEWQIFYEDLLIPVENKRGEKIIVAAIPYLRNDVVQNCNYSSGVNKILRQIIKTAREKYPETPVIMMTHMYASGAEIARRDASEKILIGGQEEVNIEGWDNHPDYMACGHIHKRQQVRSAEWARYTGSVLPMSFAEINYQHGVDLVTFSNGEKPKVTFLEYTPKHKLIVLPDDDRELSTKKLMKEIREKLNDRSHDMELDDNFDYILLKVKQDKLSNEEIRGLEELVETKNAVLCKIQKIIPSIDLTTLTGGMHLESIEDIMEREAMETLKETFILEHGKEMSDEQKQMLQELLDSLEIK